VIEVDNAKTKDGRIVVRAILLPHSHWDREWYEPFAVFRDKLVVMLDGVLDGLANEPGFTHFHLDGQAIMLDDYLAVRPEREAEVRALVESGRLSVGPLYTLTDEFLVSGESIYRNLEWGMERARRWGAPSPIDGPWAGYMPDQFGHIGQFPQILQAFGIKHAVILRGVSASIGTSVFRWRAPNGSEVLTEYLIHGYYPGADIDDAATVEGRANELRAAIDLVASVSPRSTVLLPVGADHWAPVPGMFERAIESSALVDAEVEVSSLARFLSVAETPPDLTVWQGELRAASTWILLPNTVATRAHQKRRRGVLETRLERYAEPLAALVPGFEWPADSLERAWDLMLQNAGHDSAYGAGGDATARDVDARYDAVQQIVDPIISDAMARLAGQSELAGLLRFNPSPFRRHGVEGLSWTVDLPGDAARFDPQPVELEVSGTSLVLSNGASIRFTDEDDEGDLFTFSPAGVVLEPTVTSVGTVARVVFADVTIEVAATTAEGEDHVRLHLRIDNKKENHRLRMRVKLPDAPTGSVALAPFEVVDRELVGEGYESEVGSVTWPASGAVLAAGTALLGEGVFEYEVDGDELAVTLLRAVGEIAKPTVPTRPIWAGPSIEAPEGQCLGVSEVALGVRVECPVNELVATWEAFALPLLSVYAPGGGALSPDSLAHIEGPQVSSVRRVGPDTTVRVWNDDPTSPRVARVNGAEVHLGPAEIRQLTL